MNKFSKVVLASMLALSGSAFAGVINANTEGWITDGGADDNPGLTSGEISNMYAGAEGGDTYNNFMSFVLPTNVTIASATLSIYNPGMTQSQDANALYSLYQATGYSFAGLMSGSALGSTSVSAIDNGTNGYATITLNAAGIAALTAAEGTNFTFGGNIATTTSPFCTDCTWAFGATNGTPLAYLTLTPVPEPTDTALLLAGLGLVGFAARRKKQA